MITDNVRQANTLMVRVEFTNRHGLQRSTVVSVEELSQYLTQLITRAGAVVTRLSSEGEN